MESIKLDLRIPEYFIEYNGEEIMSNFDHLIKKETAKTIKGRDLFSRYSGWNFNGMVWWAKGWNCEVWCYRSYIETFSGELEDIMNDVSDKYGQD